MFILHSFCSLIALGWLYAIFRTLRAMKRKRFELHPDSPTAVAGEVVSIVIPARNEENNIQACLLSALRQD